MKKLLFALVLLCVVSFCYGQDIHFSQFYNSPLTINPALTGKENAKYRANLNYRGQWYTIGNSRGISTIAASGDMRVLEDALPSYDNLGIGLQFFHDSAGDGYYNTTSIAPSIAYHKALGYNHKIAAGLQPGYANTSLDFSGLTFEEQYIGTGFDQSLPTGENFATDNRGYFDLGGGILYSYRSSDESWSAYGGGSLFHINSPEINLLDGTAYNRPVRKVLNGGATMFLQNGFVVSPSVLYMEQSGATELTVGAIAGRTLGNPRMVGANKSVYGGVFWRKDDAIIGKAGLQWDNMQLGISSDFAISDISDPLGLSSALEFSLTFLGEPEDESQPIFCPTF